MSPTPPNYRVLRGPYSKPASAVRNPVTAERFTFFWAGVFSQWHIRPFPVDDIWFNCCEQFMMAKKAELFGDLEYREKIMNTSDPKTQKSLGRDVAGFVESTWAEASIDIVRTGNLAKFRHHADLREQLFATHGTTLVEASPYDTIWGIGLRATDPRAQTRATWRGQNHLGHILTEVREILALELKTGAAPKP